MNHLKNLAISENNIIFNPLTGQSYETNDFGRRIIKSLIEGVKISSIISELSSEFKKDEDAVTLDVYDFLTKLKIFGLVDLNLDLS